MITMPTRMRFLFLGFAAGASIDFGVVSIFFHLNYAGLVAFGIKVVSGIYIPIIKKGICAIATD